MCLGFSVINKYNAYKNDYSNKIDANQPKSNELKTISIERENKYKIWKNMTMKS